MAVQLEVGVKISGEVGAAAGPNGSYDSGRSARLARENSRLLLAPERPYNRQPASWPRPTASRPGANTSDKTRGAPNSFRLQESAHVPRM